MQTLHHHPNNRFQKALWALVTAGLLAISIPGWAAFDEDVEKPKPDVNRQGETMTAKLIPRGKSTSVLIRFQVVEGGQLLDVAGADFEEADLKGIDPKDFRSDLFAVKVGDIPPGGAIKLAVSSNYFTQATELWVLNRALTPPWMNGNAEHIDRPERVEELVLTATDGGPFDSDGAANGEIAFLLGPRDSFWGYALGTLFIRFFGVFLVLSVLMLGMMLAGLVFQRLDRRKAIPKAAPVLPRAAVETAKAPDAVDPETAAAIGVALHLHLSALRAAAVLNLEPSDGSSWARQGRSQIMRDRLLTQDRAGRK
jgi:Na+-transporting methylmalonyl-CoA/oxaloacetate decarboxylase gamma subunit